MQTEYCYFGRHTTFFKIFILLANIFELINVDVFWNTKGIQDVRQNYRGVQPIYLLHS